MGIFDRLVPQTNTTKKGYCMPTVPNGGRSLGGRIQAGDDKAGPIVQEASERVGKIPRVRGGPGGGSIGGKPKEPESD